jgi:hypothetical protein
MSTLVIALLVALGGGTWAYTKIQRITGNNAKTSLTMGALAAIILFLLSYILLGFIPE